jgi:coenzyme F420-reducing hydrogenase delta subunit/ferredoxin
VTFHAALRDGTRTALQHVERVLDPFFGAADNPLRHLGALCLLFLWIVTATGLYLYTVLDTSVAGVHETIDWLTLEQWYLGGILRSLHRYCSDALVVTMLLHLLHEWAFDRYHGFRWYSWITGVPLIWLVFFSGIGGYWIVWDQLAQFSAVATTELLDWLPLFGEASARNFIAPAAMTDRFFTFLVFLHIGIPLLTILGAWAHVHRISNVDHFPARRLALGMLLAMLVLSVIHPALSDAPADLSMVPTDVRMDWFLLFIHPLTYVTSAGLVWALLLGLTLLLFALPLLPHAAQGPIARVDPPNCNGCRRCYIDCPYGAVTMAAHPDKPGHQIAVVNPEYCASCGICVGACPSSTPFRSQESLVTGIDMPQQPIGVVRQQLEAGLARLTGETRIVLFGCDSGVDVKRFAGADTASFSLICSGMLPPSFVEYALRGGADGVLITGCSPGGCPWRLGNRWTSERLAHRREPHLRDSVPRDVVREIWIDAGDAAGMKAAIDEFRTDLTTQRSTPLVPFSRRTSP